MNDAERCIMCHRVLDNPDDPLSKDCGGDCLKCMADCGDTDCEEEIEKLRAEGKIK